MNACTHCLSNYQRAALAAALALPLLLSGCDRRKVEDDSTRSPAEATTPDGAATSPAIAPESTAPPAPDQGVATNAPEPPDASEAGAAGSTTQADALALLMTVDEHEIAAADQALGKNVTGPVLNFAQMMKTDHGMNLTDTTRLGGAVSTTPAVDALKKQGEASLRTLAMQSGTAYEKAYIDAMVRGHTEALALIDGTLLPAATDANIRQHFTATRATVARHLERAKEIQASLK